MPSEHIIKTYRNPYGSGFSPTRPKEITLKTGVTVLVGCNGAGKTTLINNIKEQLNKEDIPVYHFDNLRDGGSKAISEHTFRNNIQMAAKMAMSSEGENISNNLSDVIGDARLFIKTGKNKNNMKLFDILDDKNDKPIESDERWFLFDAIDSGYSIDNVIEIKDIFDLMIEDAKNFNVNLYIIVSANAYELARNENCFDVMNGKYRTFTDYDDYRKFIMHSREKKNNRYKNK